MKVGEEAKAAAGGAGSEARPEVAKDSVSVKIKFAGDTAKKSDTGMLTQFFKGIESITIGEKTHLLSYPVFHESGDECLKAARENAKTAGRELIRLLGNNKDIVCSVEKDGKTTDMALGAWLSGEGKGFDKYIRAPRKDVTDASKAGGVTACVKSDQSILSRLISKASALVR